MSTWYGDDEFNNRNVNHFFFKEKVEGVADGVYDVDALQLKIHTPWLGVCLMTSGFKRLRSSLLE